MILPLAIALRAAPPVPGDAVAPFELRTLAGVPYRWTPGRATVLSFCAFWCDTWKDQLPRVREAMRITEGLPIDFATISVDGRWTELGKRNAVGTMLGDPGGAWTRRFGVDRVPATLVVAPDGRIRWASYGVVRTASLVDALRGAIGVGGKNVASPTVYLTFDDFPAPRLSYELLDLLRAEGVRATFFCLGSKAEANAALLKRAVREGHALGVHSWSHDAADPQLDRCVAAIRRATGVAPTLYRPPGSERILSLSGKPLPFPVADPYDYARPGADELVRRIALRARPGTVIQLHAGVDETLRALPAVLKNLRGRGMTFAPLSAPK